ncbi:MAG TPA: hypothetical protein VHA11_02410 [Bryobacteraceae bacterium]|nr:hypothetical protein [Bryobacteraceae bacterium]
MTRPVRNPLADLDHRELIWLFGILKEACQERLEKNLVTQALEDRLHQRHGDIPGRVDPRPTLKEWEPRYRRLLAAATELHDLLRATETSLLVEALAEQFATVRKAR